MSSMTTPSPRRRPDELVRIMRKKAYADGTIAVSSRGSDGGQGTEETTVNIPARCRAEGAIDTLF